MGILVQKYGGTSVGTIERIISVARRIKTSIERGDRVVVVVSAMAGVTNKLVEYANILNGYEGSREYDVVISAGEQVAAGLIAIELNNLGLNAKSYMAWQVPIITTNDHGQADILDVHNSYIVHDLDIGVIPIICGFQGVSEYDEITTIGRGGSDLTAVAVAAAINADMCEIYSDVDGVYTADPNKVATANLINNISYAEMLEFSLNGARVLQAKSVDYAMKNNVRVRAASSFINSPGTIVSVEQSSNKQIIGICSNSNLVHFTINKLHFEKANSLLAENFVRIVNVVESSAEYIVTINQSDMRNVAQIFEIVLGRKHRLIFQNSEFCNISVVGFGIGDNRDIEGIINASLQGINIYKTVKLKNSINITVLKRDELEILSILHELFMN